jgi:hypothetical protein
VHSVPVYPGGRGGPSDGAHLVPVPVSKSARGTVPSPRRAVRPPPGAPASTGSGLKATGTAGMCRPLQDEKPVST